MKRVWLLLLAGLVASSAMAGVSDSVRPIMTAEEACKLAYAWTGFDKNRPADLIPKCRAELVDSGYLKHARLKEFVKSNQIWLAVFDSVRVCRPGMTDSVLRSQPLKWCSVMFEPSTKQMILLTLITPGVDASKAAPPEKRKVWLNSGYPLNAQPALDFQASLEGFFAWRLTQSGITEAIWVNGSCEDRRLEPSNYWWICKRGTIDRLTHGGQLRGAESALVNATTGKIASGLHGWGE